MSVYFLPYTTLDHVLAHSSSHGLIISSVYLQEDSSAMVEETSRPIVSLLHVLSGLLRLVVHKLLGETPEDRYLSLHS